MRTYSFRERIEINLMDYGDGNDVTMQYVFRSYEEIVEEWECFKVTHDYEVVSIIYEIKVVSEYFCL